MVLPASPGFYAGGYLALVAVQRFAPGSFEVAAFVIGGVIVAILDLIPLAGATVAGIVVVAVAGGGGGDDDDG